MASERKEVRLGDLVKVEHGWPFKSEFFAEEAISGPIVVNIGNFKYTGGFRFESTTIKKYVGPYPTAYELSPGDLLLVMTCQTPGGEILGIPGRIPNDGRLYLHNQRIGKVAFKDRDRLDPAYLYYLCLGRDFNRTLCQTATGTKILHTSPSRIEDFKFQLPAIAEQKRIAGILGALDDKIELNRKMNATLEQMAQALFKSWFVDFDPVHAKAAGRQPTGMDKATADLFPDSFVDSELGKIPEGWKVNQLEELVDWMAERIDATPAKDKLRYIALEDMPSRSLDLSSYQLGSAVSSSIIRFEEGDILFGSMRPYFHKVGLAFFEGITRTTTFVMKPKKRHLRHFALLHIFSDDLISFATTSSVGTTIPYVKWESLARYRVITPPEELLSRFDDMIRGLIVRIGVNGAESLKLAAIRETLLARLFIHSTTPNANV